MYLLVVEKDQDLVAQIYDFFEASGHIVDAAYDGAGGKEFADRNSYDIIMLNSRLPDMKGAELCYQLRQTEHTMPILMYGKGRSMQNKLDSFANGADDYVLHPFDFRELDARIQALVRRANQSYVSKPVHIGDLSFDPATLQISRAGNTITLPPISLRILAYLIQQSPAVVSRRQIERHIWGNDRPETDALRAHLYTLRNAIDKPYKKKLLHTVRGMGYQLALIN